jgi:hypothetical protein
MEFEAFPKVPRLNRGVVITEKIDGTNAQVLIYKTHNGYNGELAKYILAEKELTPPGEDQNGYWAGDKLVMLAGSRNRYIVPGDDNYGFARWVAEWAHELWFLGEGRHFGEWWGQGIQRQYGLDHKRWSLFNTSRWNPVKEGAIMEKLNADGSGGNNPFNRIPGLDVVPIVYHGDMLGNGPWSTNPDPVFMPQDALHYLTWNGSLAAPGFKDAEGIMVYFVAARHMMKATVKDDDKPKGREQVAAKEIIRAEDGQPAQAA